MAANNRSSGSGPSKNGSSSSSNIRHTKKSSLTNPRVESNTTIIPREQIIPVGIKSQNSPPPFPENPYFHQPQQSSLGTTSDLCQYELAAYHHHLRAIQMGQFYNPELNHYSVAAAAALAMRPPPNTSGGSGAGGGSSSSGSGGGSGPSGLRVNGNAPPSVISNPGSMINSNWINNAAGRQRLVAFDYPQNYIGHEYGNQLALQNGVGGGGGENNITVSSELWPVAIPMMEGNRKSGSNETGQRTGPTKTKKPRRRVASVAQRRAANIRERRRMFSLNEGFDKLRRKVPTFAYEKRLSRIETLRLAVTYIGFMGDLLAGPPDDLSALRPLQKSIKASNNNNNNNNTTNDRSVPTLGINQHQNSIMSDINTTNNNTSFLTSNGSGGGGLSGNNNDIRHYTNGLGGFNTHHLDNNNSNGVIDQGSSSNNNVDQSNQNVPRISPYPVGHVYYHTPPSHHHSAYLPSNIHHHHH